MEKQPVPIIDDLKIGYKSQSIEILQKYLHEIGYLKIEGLQTEYESMFGNEIKSVSNLGEFDNPTLNALLNFQKNNNLIESGVLDAPTVDRIETPRCGFPDIRLKSLGDKWNRFALTYCYIEMTSDLNEIQIKSAMQEAFQIWGNVTPFSFTEVAITSSPDIVIRFVIGAHGDNNPFENPVKVLAHAFYPPPNGGTLAGDIHFNDAVIWNINLPIPQQQYDLIATATHEIGHSLGLSHSNNPQSIMWPYITNGQRKLNKEDIFRIRLLYGLGWKTVIGNLGTGVGGFPINSPLDRAFAFDYNSSGKLDHIFFYRPSSGAFAIIRKNADNSFEQIDGQPDPGKGIGGFPINSPLDRAFAFDYNSSSKLDHIFFYRPSSGAFAIIRKNADNSFEQIDGQPDPGKGIGGFDLASPLDRAFAFDYDGSGKLDHIVFYRPSSGAIFILKKNGESFEPVFAQRDPDGSGIGGFDIRSKYDRAIAFDYNKTGSQDHLIFYRPPDGIFFILAKI